MTERERILSRVREALTVTTPQPGLADHGQRANTGSSARARTSAARDWLPSVGESFAEQIQLFRTNAAELRADFHLLDRVDELAPLICRTRDAEAWKRVATHAGELTEAVCKALDLPILRADQPYDVNELEMCDVGITACDALVAQTGSVMITSRSAGGRALSVLPPHHLVIARREQLVPDLPAAFENLRRVYGANYPSFISFVTGPSRTGDIERILVLGAHGPKKLTVICL